jgi:hypothetical protein
MEFHPSKCNILRITKKKSITLFDYKLHGQILKCESTTKYLGVTIANDLNWNRHIDQTAAKGNKRLGFVKRNLKVKNQDLKALAYKSLVRPTLEYSSTVWDPYTMRASKTLEMVQRRAARWVTGDYAQTSSVTAMLQQLKWRDLAQRRADARIMMLYKIIYGLVRIPQTSYFHMQRDGQHIQPIHSNTLYFQYSFFPRTIADWNRLPTTIIAAPSIVAFRSQLTQVSHTLPY